MSDPGLITASQLISAAEERARRAENQVRSAEDRAQKAEAERDELVKELAALSCAEVPVETKETAARLVSYLYHKFERANWGYDEEDGIPAHAIKDYLIDWLAEALEKASPQREAT